MAEEPYDLRAISLSFIGPLLVFLPLLAAQEYTDLEFFNTSFGAAVVILFALQSPAGRPAHVFLGQILAGIIGICFRQWIPVNYMWLSSAFAVSLCTFVLKCLKISYPPAGATVLLLTQSKDVKPWRYLLFPLLVGSAVMFGVAYVVINLMYWRRKYPDKLM